MRGLWDNEQPLSPSLLKSALALVAGFLAVLAAVNVLMGVGAIFAGHYGSALVQFTGGLAIPFAIWLALRMLADMLILQHRSLDRFNTMIGVEASTPVAEPAPVRTVAETAASDDGPAYPEDD
ncbi:MAG: hypothetical protein ABI740_01165 [Alphaproteobacteria bacterium]